MDSLSSVAHTSSRYQLTARRLLTLPRDLEQTLGLLLPQHSLLDLVLPALLDVVCLSA